MDTQTLELLGKGRLTEELLRAGLEVAHPTRDRGIDLIAYADLGDGVSTFAARPIQMKASSAQVFSLDQKYAKFPGLLMAYVWNLADAAATVTFAMSYDQALRIMTEMGYAATASWRGGSYTSTRPGARLRGLIDPFRMTRDKWRERVAGGI